MARILLLLRFLSFSSPLPGQLRLKNWKTSEKFPTLIVKPFVEGVKAIL